jgi:hypothetical protein
MGMHAAQAKQAKKNKTIFRMDLILADCPRRMEKRGGSVTGRFNQASK